MASDRLWWLLPIFVLLGAGNLTGCDRRGVPFDQDRWLGVTEWDDYTRHRMADGLIHRKELTGKTQAEVYALLGAPPPTNYFRTTCDDVYVLGVQRSWLFGIDSEWLCLTYDGEYVSTARLVVD